MSRKDDHDQSDSAKLRDKVLTRLLKTKPKPRVVRSAKNTGDKIKDELDRLDRDSASYDPSKLADMIGQNGPDPFARKPKK